MTPSKFLAVYECMYSCTAVVLVAGADVQLNGKPCLAEETMCMCCRSGSSMVRLQCSCCMCAHTVTPMPCATSASDAALSRGYWPPCNSDVQQQPVNETVSDHACEWMHMNAQCVLGPCTACQACAHNHNQHNQHHTVVAPQSISHNSIAFSVQSASNHPA